MSDKIIAHRRDLAPSDPLIGIRGYQCENGWFVDVHTMKHSDDFAFLFYDGKCRMVEGDDYKRLLNRLEFIEKG